jgi:hypothetical protein
VLNLAMRNPDNHLKMLESWDPLEIPTREHTLKDTGANDAPAHEKRKPRSP